MINFNPDEFIRKYGDAPTEEGEGSLPSANLALEAEPEEEESIEAEETVAVAKPLGGFNPDEFLKKYGAEPKKQAVESEDYLARQAEYLMSRPPLDVEIPEPEVEGDGILRQALDIPINIKVGAVRGVKFMTDIFGADNPVSNALKSYEGIFTDLLSAESRQDQETIARIMQEAEDEGILGQIAAGLQAFTVAPLDMTAQAAGTMIPILAAGLVGKVAKLGATGVRALQAGAGGGMGVGVVKSEIYDGVYEYMLSKGVDEEEARRTASQAQAYNGKNLDSILIGGGLGIVAASTGAERIVSAIMMKAGGRPTGNLVQRIFKAGFTEAAPESAQGFQEKLSQNLALQREGADVDLGRGVFANAALEGTAGFTVGGPLGVFKAPLTPQEVAGLAKETQQAASQAKDVAPATADTVEKLADTIGVDATVGPLARTEGETDEAYRARIEASIETPDQRVARLQREAQEGVGDIELEEELPVSGLPPQPATPTPEALVTSTVAPIEPIVPAEGVQPLVTPEVVPKAENAVVEAEQKSEQESDTVKVFRGVAEAGALPTGGAFFTDSETDASAYAQLASLRKAVEDNEDLNDIVGEIMAEEGANDITDLSINTIKNIIEGNNIQVGDISEGTVLRGNVRLGNVLNLESFGSEVGSLPETWNQLNELGLVAETWQSLDEDVQAELQDKYRGKAFYSLLEEEVNLNDQFAKGVDTIVFTDQNTEGKGTHRTYLTKAAEQFAQEATPAAVTPTPVTPTPVTPEVPTAAESPALAPLRRVVKAEQTEEDVSGLVGQGLVELYNGQPVITQAGLETLPEAERPRLNPEARKIQIDTRTSEPVAEAISKNLRIGVDQVPVDVRMPAGWTLDGDIYIPPVVEAAPAPQPEARESRREPAVEIQQQYTPKTDEEQQSFDRASTNKILARSPQLAVAAVRMKNGEITAGEYADLVDILDPFVVKGAEPVPTNEKIYQYMSQTAGAKPESEQGKKKLAKIGAFIPNGKLAEFRIDIPTYNESTKNGDTVYSITGHEPVSETAKSVGETIAHLGIAKITNPQFITRTISGKGDAVQIAMGAGKFPLATVKGNYEAITELPSDINDPNAWTEAGYNPVRSSELVDVRSKQAVVGGSEAIMVGSRVFVKNAQLEARPAGVTMGERYARRTTQPTVGMTTDGVRARLEALGFGVEGMIRIVEDPQAAFEGRTIIQDGKAVRIELNASALRDNAAIDRVLNHEFAEAANADGTLNKLVERLTPKEKKEINDAITRLGYEERVRTTEEAARAIEALAAGWRGRGFFERAVARVEAWGSKLGLKLTRRAAEYIAARNLSDINAGFKAAYNRFINVRGEAREGRAFVTPEENARFLELAKDPETNREKLQKMVDEANAKSLNFNELTSLKKADFDERGYETAEGASSASISIGGFDVIIYYNSDGFFPIIRGFRGKGSDYELSTYKTLQQAKSAIRNTFIKSADPVTYDNQGNIIPLDQRFQPAEADIRYSRTEIRESRRDPAPTFTDESPEAKTLSNLKASMEKVDSASEAKGGKPTTQKVSEIAANWMEQGGDERVLQDAIIENTNLSPVNAAKVAKVIAKQYGLQQQIAETGAVIAEIAPEAEGAPRKSSVTKLIEQTTGVRKPVVKLQVSESAALKKQIQLKAREARETRKARKEAAEDLAKSITDYVKANPIRGPINSRQAMSITKRALKLDVNNEAAVDRFEMYVERVIENANYDQDLADARALIKRAKTFAKSKDTQGNVKTTLDAIANISPTLLDNPFEFNLVAQRYLLGLAPVTAKQYAVMPDADVRRYLESLETQISANQDVLDRSKAQRILDKQAAYANEKGIPLDEAIAILNSEEFLNEKTIEKLEDLTKLLTSMAQESQKDVRAYDETGATPKQKELISFMGKVNLDSLTNEQKKRYIRFSNNLLANGATFGMEQFQSIALGQESAIKALKDKRLSNKLAAWISPIGGDKAIDTARRIALKTQSEADTFKNIFGREAVGAFRKILGLNRLDVAQTDSNRAKEQIANEFGEYFKGLRKKYGNDATGFEAKGYAGIAGYLIQTDGIKTEAESIPYRRRLMEQNIVELRKSDKRADLAEADLKERALVQLTGTSNAEILSQLQSLNPASYEQLMWVKDTMLPKWRDFLKEHDENFRNQANNYNNPDHLTITYKFPEGQLLPNEIEDVYQQDAIGMRIKQAANSIKRKEHSNLPVSPRTGTVANIDINFGYNQYNALVDQVDKAFVAPAWEQVVAFTKDQNFEQVMGGRANATFVKKLLTDIQTSRTRQSMTDDEAQMVAGGVRLARKISTQAVLGGFTQPLRQVPDQLTKLFLTTGRWDLITKNLLRIAEGAPLMNKFPIGRRGDAQAGTQYASQFSELARKVEASVTDRKWAQYRELMNRVGEFWMAPLRGSDVWAAKVSWMSYYEAELNKNGIKMESWEREAELVETDDARKEAASYAEFAVDFYGGASDPTKMASLSKQTNNGWKEFAKLLFLPLNSFALQQKNSLISDLRDAYLRTGDRKASIAAISGTLAGMAAFHGMRIYIIGGLLYPAGKALLMGIFGIDMDEPDEEEKQKQLEDNWRKFKASMYGNIVAGGAGEFAEKAAIDAVNRTAYLWDANIKPDSLLNDKGEIMSFRQYEKEVSPLYRFRSYGSSEYSFGLADVLTEQATHSLAETQQLLTPEEMERYTGNEQAYAAFATGVEWMYFFRLMDTDVKRIATDLKRQMDKGVEEREKEIKSIRSGR